MTVQPIKNPRIAVVGRPNVGKSTMFNKLIGRRVSIVDNTPGVTRDRIYGDVEWGGWRLTLVDTGGLEEPSGDKISSGAQAQSMEAIRSCDIVLFVTDLQSGVTAADHEIAQMLKRTGKPTVLCVNKCDGVGDPPAELYEFYSLGLGDPLPVSAVHGHGTGDLLDSILSFLPEAGPPEDDPDVINVAVIGRPNAGKSSLVNHIAGEERTIVSEIAGTTRDAVDVTVETDFGRFNFIDTAGLRRQSRVDDRLERFSVERTRMAVERADVCIILCDGADGITEQDAKIAGIAHEMGKASVVAVNKSDVFRQDAAQAAAIAPMLAKQLSFMKYAAPVMISAKTGKNVNGLLEAVRASFEQACKRIPTGVLNSVLNDAIEYQQPPSDKGRPLRIYYITQASVKPPTFVMFCNDKELFHFSYQRYIENRLRESFDFTGTPIRFIIRERSENRCI